MPGVATPTPMTSDGAWEMRRSASRPTSSNASSPVWLSVASARCSIFPCRSAIAAVKGTVLRSRATMLRLPGANDTMVGGFRRRRHPSQLDHQPFIEQNTHQVGDRRLGQVGLTSDLGPAGWAPAVDRLQGESHVSSACFRPGGLVRRHGERCVYFDCSLNLLTQGARLRLQTNFVFAIFRRTERSFRLPSSVSSVAH